MTRLKSGNQLDTVDEMIAYLSEIKTKYGGDTQVCIFAHDDLGGIVQPPCHQLMIALNEPHESLDKCRLGATFIYGGDPEDDAQLERVRTNISLNAERVVLLI